MGSFWAPTPKYLREINNTGRIINGLKWSQEFHWVCTKVHTLSKVKICLKCRVERITRAYKNTLLYYITLFLRWLVRRKTWVNGRQLCFDSSGYLTLRFVTMSVFLISYHSSQFTLRLERFLCRKRHRTCIISHFKILRHLSVAGSKWRTTTTTTTTYHQGTITSMGCVSPNCRGLSRIQKPSVA